jgi:trigger factor
MEDSSVPLREGDTAVIDFEGFVDGVAFEGGKGSNHKLEIGSGHFIPGFEEQLIGASAGGHVEVKVTFPEKYHSEDLAGKDAVFQVQVNETKQTIKPDLDDEFAQDVSEFDTLEEYKSDIRKKLEHQREHQVDEEYESALIDKLLEGFEGEIPDVMIEEQLDSIMQDFGYRLSMQGLDLSQYLKYTGQSMEDMQNMHRENARRHVMCDLAFHAIAKAEGLEVSEQEMEDEYQKLAERYKMPAENVRAAIPEKSLRRDMLGLKGSEFIREHAQPVIPGEIQAAPDEGKTEAEPKPQKTARAKKSAKSEKKPAGEADV